MILSEILEGIPCEIRGNQDLEIADLQYDSRKVKSGDLFFCIAGFEQDGHQFAPGAVKNGALAIVVQDWQDNLDVTQVRVLDSRKAMAQAACNFCGNPSHSMKMIGITGTNGKTTTTYMIKKIAETAGMKVGLIGTIQNMIGDTVLHTERTTPESVDLQKLLKRMREENCALVVMEVSSHSLCLHRTYGISFDIGIFSNLTQDHLDFHKTWQDYMDAKSMLFAQSALSIINADDACADYMSAHAKGNVLTYSAHKTADFYAGDISMTPQSTRYTLHNQHNRYAVDVGIPGMFTVYNSLAAISACAALGIDMNTVLAGIHAVSGVSGRFESLPTHGDCTLILDYAHTPDSLESSLKTIRQFAKGRVVSVFGCGGNRDKTKRPKMGDISARLADFSIVTTDNPRFEKPADIIADIVQGIKKEYNNKYICIEDRREAIAYALSHAQPKDVILLAGKGHETYQEICGVKHDFDEKVIVAEIVDELKSNGVKKA